MEYTYTLLTPARNEENYIEGTIKSVVAQTITPKKWIIISDGSTDRTDEIVQKYSKKYDWLELLRMPDRKKRKFTAKVNCLNAGYAKLKNIQYDLIAFLDADLTFEENYFEFLIGKFKEKKKLGVAGTPFVEGSFNSFKDSSQKIEHVSGACQVFRKECYKDIGGYTPVKGGGEDWVAVTSSRMKGWITRTFPEKYLIHHRKMGTVGNNIFKARLSQGFEDYYLGGHPIWEIFRIVFQIMKKPYIIGGICIFVGFLSGYMRGQKRPVSKELMKFSRKEQMRRLNSLYMKILRRKN